MEAASTAAHEPAMTHGGQTHGTHLAACSRWVAWALESRGGALRVACLLVGAIAESEVLLHVRVGVGVGVEVGVGVGVGVGGSGSG